MTLTQWLGLIAGLSMLSACQTPKPAFEPLQPPSFNPFSVDTAQVTGNLQHPELSEVSGLAASTRRANLLWAINDSGNGANLYALSPSGQSLGKFAIAAKNRDWEDMASASINGESYLLIGDIGDNLRAKDEHAIHVLAEPVLDSQTTNALIPLHTIRFRYPQASHNSESMAYANGWVYVLTKESIENNKRQASEVYRFPLELSNPNKLLVAEKIASLAIPKNTMEASVIASLSGVDIFQPTAFDIDAKNCFAYVLTYRSIYRYQRQPEQTWAQVLAQPRQRVHTHSLSQAEALAVSDNGVVWFTSEKKPAPLWALPGVPANARCN